MTSWEGETESRCRLVVGTLVFLSALIIAGWSALRLYESFGPPARGDFKRMWAAAGVFQSGGNPYDVRALAAFSAVRGAGEMIDLPVYVPPVGFPFLLLIADKSFEGARSRYLIGIGCIGFLLWIVPLIQSQRDIEPIQRVLALAAMVTFFPLLLMWWVGPLSAWPLIGISLCGVLIGRRGAFSRFCGGLALMLLLVKPNCAPLVLPLFVGFCAATRRWAELLGIVTGGAIGLYGVCTIAAGRPFIEALTETGLWITPAPLRALGWPMTPLPLRLIPVIVGALGAFVAGIKTRDLESFSKRVAFIIVPLGLCVSPFVWTYDFTPLALTIAAMARFGVGRETGRTSLTVSQWLIIAVIALNVLLTVSPLAMELHWWYPLGFLILGILFYRDESIGLRGAHADGKA